MAVKLYVGNLPYSTADADLTELFAEYGTVVSASVISDRETGRSKGFGFVEIEEEDKAKAAVEALNGKDFGGRNIVVNEARPREERPRGGDRGGFGGDRGGNGGSFRQRSW
jgi:cold-inducible RNA-binding protein